MNNVQPASIAATRTSSLKSIQERYADTIAGYLFLLPFVVVYVLFRIYPLFRGFYISLHDWELVGTHRKYVGLENYRSLLWNNLEWDVPYQVNPAHCRPCAQRTGTLVASSTRKTGAAGGRLYSSALWCYS